MAESVHSPEQERCILNLEAQEGGERESRGKKCGTIFKYHQSQSSTIKFIKRYYYPFYLSPFSLHNNSGLLYKNQEIEERKKWFIIHTPEHPLLTFECIAARYFPFARIYIFFFFFTREIPCLPNCLHGFSPFFLINTGFKKYPWDPFCCPHTHFCFCFPSHSPRPGPLPGPTHSFTQGVNSLSSPEFTWGGLDYSANGTRERGVFQRLLYYGCYLSPNTRFAFAWRPQVRRVELIMLLHARHNYPQHQDGELLYSFTRQVPTPRSLPLFTSILEDDAGRLPFPPPDSLHISFRPLQAPGGSSVGWTWTACLPPGFSFGFGQWTAPSGESEGGRKEKLEYLSP